MIQYYPETCRFERPSGAHDTKFEIVDDDTFSEAGRHDLPACLNFASHKRPGGGYAKVRELRMPIKTQEEDLFRRSDLPEIMDNAEVREHYPLRGAAGLYCTAMVDKDKHLNPVIPFRVGIITVPAVVDPAPDDLALVERKVVRILDIAAEHGHEVLVLGAWGCGVFHNEPRLIAGLFKKHLTGDFEGAFERVIYAIPGRETENYRIFESSCR